MNWIAFDTPSKAIKCTAKIRSSQKAQTVLIRPVETGGVDVKFENMQKSIAPGQSIVFYDEDVVLGGGIIDEVR